MVYLINTCVVHMNPKLKEEAINLRRQGLSYSEILKQISVAKSTLSLWLRSVGLSKRQYQRLTEKKLAAMQRGAEAKRQQRIDLVQKIRKDAKNDIKSLTNRDLWLSGIMLYWAEGSKEHENSIGNQVQFSNSDPKMIKVFLRWLKEIIKIPKQDIIFEIYIHETGNTLRALDFWSKILSCDKNQFRVYFKKHHIKKTNRKNIGDNYYGLIRVRVKRSSNLNRKIAAWVNAICLYWEVV